MSLTLVVVITIKPAPKYVCTHIRTVFLASCNTFFLVKKSPQNHPASQPDDKSLWN